MNFQKEFLNSNRFYLAVTAFIVAVFLFLAIGNALTTSPESDEGNFANPAYNLVTEGHFGTTVLESEKSPLTRIEQRTYWVMPLFLLNVAASFKVFGFSLLAMRSVSVFWGLILIASWFFIVLKLSSNRFLALLCAMFVAFNYVILVNASFGRGDTMCAGLGFAAIAIYLWTRERNLLLAILFSQTLVTCAGLTHFNGILAFFALAFLTIYFDFRSLGWRHVLVAAVPYLIGGAAFGIWVLQDPQAFKDQFIDNAVMSGRMEGFSSPLAGFIREFTMRYPRAFGLLESSAGHSGPIYLKSLILLGYAFGVLGVIFSKELRRSLLGKVLLYSLAIYFVLLALIDGQKLAVYLVYVVPFYSAMMAIWIYHLGVKKILPIPILILGACGFLFLQTGGIALRIKQNNYGRFYRPAIEYLNANAKEGETIMGSAEARFELESKAMHFADGRFAYYTGKRPTYIISDPGVDDSWKSSKIHFPEFYVYFPKLLSEEYEVVYENEAFKIYKKRGL